MRRTGLLALLAGLLLLLPGRAAEFPSPDGRWTLVVYPVGKAWPNSYLYFVQNRHTGARYFFQTSVVPDEALPQEITPLWSPGGRYLALTVDYSPQVECVEVIHCRDLPRHAGFPQADEEILLKPRDQARFESYRQDQAALRWAAPDELVVESTMIAHPRPGFPGPATLWSDLAETVRFHAGQGTVVRRQRLGYELGE